MGRNVNKDGVVDTANGVVDTANGTVDTVNGVVDTTIGNGRPDWVDLEWVGPAGLDGTGCRNDNAAMDDAFGTVNVGNGVSGHWVFVRDTVPSDVTRGSESQYNSENTKDVAREERAHPGPAGSGDRE